MTSVSLGLETKYDTKHNIFHNCGADSHDVSLLGVYLRSSPGTDKLSIVIYKLKRSLGAKNLKMFQFVLLASHI